jgi:hypothetical protein
MWDGRTHTHTHRQTDHYRAPAIWRGPNYLCSFVLVKIGIPMKRNLNLTKVIICIAGVTVGPSEVEYHKSSADQEEGGVGTPYCHCI